VDKLRPAIAAAIVGITPHLSGRPVCHILCSSLRMRVLMLEWQGGRGHNTMLRSHAQCCAEVQVAPVRYVGRPTAASPATASPAIHRAQMAEIIDTALSS
jgi:hypothetical protein